jgi:sugar phosphate isomerase/epimerase
MSRTVPFQLAVITDEIAADLETALPVARELGVSLVELNGVGGKNVSDLSEEERARARQQIAAAGMRVVAVGPPCFKVCVLDGVAAGRVGEEPVFREHMETLRRAVEAAHDFGTRLVRVFSFRRAGMQGLGNPSPRLPGGGPIPESVLERIAEGLRLACEVAAAGGVTLALENVRSCWGNSGENARRILDAVGSPHLQALWDPGNDYVSGGVPFPDGYEAVKPYLAHVHLKDARVLDPQTGLTAWECVGAGEANLPAQLAALARDGYDGVLSLETHWRLPGGDAADSTRRSMAGFRRILAALPS